MSNSIYKVIEIVGTSNESWEKAAAAAIKAATRTLRDLRVAEAKEFDIHVEDGKLVYRTRLTVSFKYEGK